MLIQQLQQKNFLHPVIQDRCGGNTLKVILGHTAVPAQSQSSVSHISLSHLPSSVFAQCRFTPHRMPVRHLDVILERQVLWMHAVFVSLAGRPWHGPIQANTKVARIHQGERCLHLRRDGAEVRGDSGISPDSTWAQKKIEWCERVPSPLSEEVLFIRVKGGEAAFIMAILLAQCSVCGAAGDAIKPPAWLPCNKPANRRNREILWLIKNTKMNHLSPLYRVCPNNSLCITIIHTVFVCSLKYKLQKHFLESKWLQREELNLLGWDLLAQTTDIQLIQFMFFPAEWFCLTCSFLEYSSCL